jgi:hypothetical protein
MEPADTIVVDANNIELHFASAESGQAQCVSLVSKNTVNYTTSVAPTQADVPASSSTGELTIATLDASGIVDIQLTFALSPYVEVTYSGIDVTPSVGSAWTNVDTVIVNGKRYTVRSFNITSGAATQMFATGAIPNGTTFYVSGLNGITPLPNEVLFLLSTPPHAYADREYDRYIDSSHVSVSAHEMYYTSGVVSCVASVVRQTYPLILVV